MTIDELIERLEECRDDLGGDAEVRLMMQPAWPFEYSIGGTVLSTELGGEEDDEPTDDDESEPVLFLTEGTQLQYGNSDAWDAARNF